MPQFAPFLAFNGNCTEAFEFYARTLGAQSPAIMTFGQMPGGCPPHIQDSADKVMHAVLKLDDGELHGCDALAGNGRPYEPVRGVDIILTFDTIERAQQIFTALAAGGEISMPMQPTFWAGSFGMLKDQFGIEWMVNGGPAQQ